ncbi:MAG: DUF111 family protein, partial [Eubacteriales bacterium]|nr:DUF111 family protein [Eubacteriales bacterium]
MKILYLDCPAGISGDMTLGALLDLGVSEEALRAELNKLPMHHEFSLTCEKTVKQGISGTKADVLLAAHEEHDHDHAHDHTHEE